MKITLRLICACGVILASFSACNGSGPQSADPAVTVASNKAAPAKDPVCGMEVDEAKAKAAGRMSDHLGKTYFFCSDYCKKEFDKNPEAYIKEEPAAKAEAKTQLDPVCGMDINPATAKYMSHYQDRNYYFCSESCKKQFDANPEKYLGEASRNQPHGI